MKITNSNNLSFKCQLLTKPEEFILATDSDKDKKYIKDVFEATQKILNANQIKKFTLNDTVEFERKKSKKGFKYKLIYKTPDIPQSDINKNIFENISIECNNLRSGFNLNAIIRNISYIVFYKRNNFKNLPFFASPKEIRDRAFDFNKEQSEKFPFF